MSPRPPRDEAEPPPGLPDGRRQLSLLPDAAPDSARTASGSPAALARSVVGGPAPSALLPDAPAPPELLAQAAPARSTPKGRAARMRGAAASVPPPAAVERAPSAAEEAVPVAPVEPRIHTVAELERAPSAAEAAVPAAPVGPRTHTVAELVRAARQALESRFADVLVEGEVSNLRRQPNGHVYFSLKDPAADAQIDCVMWGRDAARLRWKPEDGLAVRCRGRLTIYEGRGKFQLAVVAMEPTGAGALALAFEQLKKKLAAEGLFAEERKRPLPFIPRRLGVVTSPTGAVIRDIIRVAHRRYPVPILLAPAPVQGPGAEVLLAAALGRLALVPDVDVIILARGGGSLEDLWSFNEETLARAIATCPVPVISAVGHETDVTIADFVADVRASTPSNAAERAVPVAAELRLDLRTTGTRLARAAHAQVQRRRLALERERARLGDPRRVLHQRRQRVDECGARLERAVRARLRRSRDLLRAIEATLAAAHPRRRVTEQRAAIEGLRRRLERAAAGALVPRRRSLHALGSKLDALSPLKVLERGYGLVRGPGGRLVTRAGDVAEGEALRITVSEGEIDAAVVAARPGSGDRRR